MGFSIKQNWALQIEVGDVKENSTYEFAKKGNRVYPIAVPIDLISPERDAIAKVEILEFTNSKSGTTGKYRIIKLYKGQEKEILTKYWQENI